MAEKDTKKSSKEDKKYSGFSGKTGIEAAAVEKAFIKQYNKSGPSQGPSDDVAYQKALMAAMQEARDEIRRETKGKAPDAYAKGGAVTKKPVTKKSVSKGPALVIAVGMTKSKGKEMMAKGGAVKKAKKK